MTPAEPQIPNPPAAPAVASTSPASAHVPVFDTPHTPAADVAPPPPTTHTPTSEAGTTYVGGPAPTANPSAAAASAGPLPAYGADIKPAAPTAAAPATAPAAPPPAAAASAPVTPSSGAGGIGQPAVVRRPDAVPPPSPTPMGMGEQTAVATAGGASAGVASAAATARARLQRLVDFVARQEPRLNWAAGDRPDGTTVLVTDLASGWIPPGIDIPVGVQLCDPAKRRGDLEALLGEVTITASYTRLHHVPPADDDEPVPTSPRARQVPAIEELGWELGQATNWRDGLPRLAHTLAKAASRGTGVLDTEIETLRELLTDARDRVLDSYPDDVDAAAVGNWQLLASINALVEGDKTGANYHFAWFQALSQVTTGG
ncbi:DUF5632 domain-containing protein [Mycobacterium heckeshornense]|uniref:DUF5632 domain-containing protein n=1 Tax=Mycobacterium heckeshornense TaxID=110505 RepID=UPI00194498D1|nr:DUF5631 domain-containing protein [Mycobacterium heckeshornense]